MSSVGVQQSRHTSAARWETRGAPSPGHSGARLVHGPLPKRTRGRGAPPPWCRWPPRWSIAGHIDTHTGRMMAGLCTKHGGEAVLPPPTSPCGHQHAGWQVNTHSHRPCRRQLCPHIWAKALASPRCSPALTFRRADLSSPSPPFISEQTSEPLRLCKERDRNAAGYRGRFLLCLVSSLRARILENKVRYKIP